MTLTYDNYLEHYGVKGMKWGIRKGETKKSVSKERYERIKESQNRSFQVTSKSGDILDVEVSKPLKLVNWIASKSEKSTNRFINSPTLNLSHNGKNVGDASIAHVSKDELNLVWLGINPKHRGKGYASAAFDSAVEYGKQKGYTKITLEVPGNAPDARHIYEKRGFKVVKEPTQKEIQNDFMWGGLTHMSLDLDTIRHSNNYDDDLDKALLNTFVQMSEEEWNFVFDEVEHSITYDNYLEHYGVKGMKWGVRKNRGERTPEQQARRDKAKSVAKKAAVGLAVVGGAVAVGYATRNTPQVRMAKFVLNSHKNVLKENVKSATSSAAYKLGEARLRGNVKRAQRNNAKLTTNNDFRKASNIYEAANRLNVNKNPPKNKDVSRVIKKVDGGRSLKDSIFDESVRYGANLTGRYVKERMKRKIQR